MVGGAATILAMFGLVFWVWSQEISLASALLAWLGLCALIRLNALAMDTGRPGPHCYALALVPAVSPYLVVLAVFGVWAPLAG